MNKLDEVQAACKYGAVIVINNHIGTSDTAADSIREIGVGHPLCTAVYLNEEVEKEILRLQELVIIKLQLDAYQPRFVILHYSLSGAIEQAWKLLKEKKYIA